MGFGAPAASRPSPPAPAPASAPSRLPDDFDPFADFQSTPSPTGRPAAPIGSWDLPKAAPAPASASPFDLTPGASSLPGDLDLMGAVAPAGSQSLDQMFGLGGGTSSSNDPLANFLKQTAPEAPADAAVGAPSNVDPLALLSSRENIVDEPLGGATQARSALPDEATPSAAEREHMSATFSFMSTKPAVSSAPAPVAAPASAEASPFADLGLGTPASAAASVPVSTSSGSSLLDDLDLSPQTVPAVHVPASRPATVEQIVDLTVPLSITPIVEPLETQLPIPQTALPKTPIEVPVTQAAQAQLHTDQVPLTTAIRPAVQTVVTQQPVAAPTSTTTTTTTTTSTSAAPGDNADAQALWAAFCEGAGVKFAPPQGLNPDLMRVIGQLLHHAVDGSLKLVAARAATKQEMRAEVTVIQSRANNPLKFSPDTQSALEQMLQPPMRGFMSGPEAVADAMDDLLGHTIGTMVGMRAALEGVLARFEPEQLESKLVGRSMMDSLLPMNRRAKLWELYLQHYGTVRAEAQDDFHNLFGRAFLQAYEEQLDRLDAERRVKPA